MLLIPKTTFLLIIYGVANIRQFFAKAKITPMFIHIFSRQLLSSITVIFLKITKYLRLVSLSSVQLRFIWLLGNSIVFIDGAFRLFSGNWTSKLYRLCIQNRNCPNYCMFLFCDTQSLLSSCFSTGEFSQRFYCYEKTP